MRIVERGDLFSEEKGSESIDANQKLFWGEKLTTVKKHIEWMQKNFKPEDVVAVPIWQVDDVLHQAKEKGIEITKEQAEEVLDRIDRKQDANLGITWTTIDCYLEDL